MVEMKLLRLEEVAARLGISYTAVRMLVLYEDKIPWFKVGSRGIRVKAEDLEKYIASTEQKMREEQPSRTAPADKDTGKKEVYEGRKILSSEEKK